MGERKTRKPTDAEVLAAVQKYGNRAMTYVVRNVLVMDGHFPIETPWVLRQLKRLEKVGAVVRVPSYAGQPPPLPAAKEARGERVGGRSAIRLGRHARKLHQFTLDHSSASTDVVTG
jgi:hypothetical protein